MPQRTLASALGFFTFDHVLTLLGDGNGINETMGGLTMRVVHVFHICMKSMSACHVGYTLVFIVYGVYDYDWLCLPLFFSSIVFTSFICRNLYFINHLSIPILVDRNLTDQRFFTDSFDEITYISNGSFEVSNFSSMIFSSGQIEEIFNVYIWDHLGQLARNSPV